ncbi:hypothetical protein TSUD_329530 [Trifolium subterraneum]|nr:hypothetical protein TSUD_329530 [Trifolium subterraneum]
MCRDTESCTSSSNNQQKAEEVIIGNAKAIQKLRELITLPLLFPHEANKLQTGLLMCGPPGTGKTKLKQAVEWPMNHPAAFSRLGITPNRGILLHGPPGCSKTTLAKAAANAANVPFFSLRGDSSSSSSAADERLLSTLLTEMDGLEEAKGVLVFAATNRPYLLDAALMRPGRFDMILYVPPPDLEGRLEILNVHTRRMKLQSDVDLRKLAEDTELFTGAELAGLCREVGTAALRENIDASVVFNRHFQIVKNALNPTLTKEAIDSYSSFRKTSSRSVV